MKIRFYLALAAAALVMTNCSQDEELVQVKQSTKGFTATIEGASRSDVTEAGVFSWTAGDAISVWNGETFDVYANSEGNESTFVAEDEENAGTPTGYAIYPASEDHEFADGNLKVNLPATYTHGSTNAPMLATIKSGSSTLAFKHLGGLMRFVVKNVPVGASSFVFTTTSNILTGGFYVNNEQIQQFPAVVPVTDENNNVTISFDALEEVAESMVFFVPLPVGTYGDYTVAIKGTNVDLSHPSTGVTNTIGRCTMLLMPEFTCTDNGLQKGAGNTIPVTQEEAANLSGIQNVTIDTDNAGTNEELDINYTPLEGNAILNITDDSGATESQASVAKIKITSQGTTPIESLNLNTPTLTAELGAGTYGTVEALTAKKTLIIAEGVTIEKLILNGGALEVDEGATINEIIVKDEAGLNSAVAAGKATLGADVTLTEALTISEDVTLDLNGKTLTGTVEGYLFESSGNLTISNGNITNVGGAVKATAGKLTMTDCEVTVTGNKRRNAVSVVGEATVVITGGKYTATGTLADGESPDWYGIGIADGKVTLNNITVEGFNGGVASAPGAADDEWPTVTINGGSYSGKLHYGLFMSGGNLTLEEDAEMEFDGQKGDIYVYTLTGTINGQSFGDQGSKTYTLEELMNYIASATLVKAIATGGTVTLETDVTLTEALAISNDVTLNLNGKTLKGNVEGYLFESSGDLTISNGYITNEGGAVKATAGKLTMTDCEVTVTGNKRRNAVSVVGEATVVITGGKYTATGTLADGESPDWYGIGIADGKVTLNNTEVKGFNGGVALAPGAADDEWPTVTINGGNYVGTVLYGLFMAGGDLTLEEDAEMEFDGPKGDIYVYTLSGTINEESFGDQGSKTYTLEGLWDVINTKKLSAE